MSELIKQSQSMTTIEKGLSLVNSEGTDSIINVKALQGKEIGLQILQLGLAESEANRVSKLTSVISLLEGKIFDPARLERLTEKEQIERYQLALSSVAQSANFVKTTIGSINWTSIEVQLLSLAAALEDANGAQSPKERKDMSAVASRLIKELADGIKPGE